MNIYQIRSLYGKNLVLGKDRQDAVRQLHSVYAAAGFNPCFIHDNSVTFARDILPGEQKKHCSNYGVCVVMKKPEKEIKVVKPKRKNICSCGREFINVTNKSTLCPPCRYTRSREQKRLNAELSTRRKKYEKENKRTIQ